MDAITKRVGERKRFQCIPKDASNVTPIVIPLNGGEITMPVKRLWVMYGDICRAIRDTPVETRPQVDKNPHPESNAYYHITAEHIASVWATKRKDDKGNATDKTWGEYFREKHTDIEDV